MSQVKLFTFENHRVRTILINNDPWFVAKDVCEVLDLEQVSRAISRLDEDEVTTSKVIDSIGREQETNVVNESGLYSLILTSRKPEAKTFKRWITHEVIPAIRKTGFYSAAPKSPAEMLLEMAKEFVVQEQRMAAIEQRNLKIESDLQTTKHRIDNLDHVDIIGDKQQRLVAMIKRYAHQEGVTWDRAWRDFTDRFNTAYNTNLKLRLENYKDKHGLKSLTRPQYLSLVDQLNDAIRVADKMLNPVGV